MAMDILYICFKIRTVFILRRRTAFAACALAAFAATGCRDYLEGDGLMPPTEYLCFYADIQSDRPKTQSRSSAYKVAIEEEEWRLEADSANGGGAATRGTLTHILEDGTCAGVIGYHYDTADDREKIIDNKEYNFFDNLLTEKTNPVKWSKVTKQKLDVYAYSPKDITATFVEAGGVPEIVDYTVKPNVKEQEDLLVANATVDDVVKNNHNPVSLSFKHALTAIRFKVGFACKVKSLTVSGVCNKGTYTFGKGGDYGGWKTVGNTGEDDYSDYTVTFGAGGDVENDTYSENDYIVNGDNTFILMPQILQEGAALKLTLGNGTVISSSLKDLKWNPGMLITYTIYEGNPPEYVYFDLAAGNVTITGIDGSTYKGYQFEDDGTTPKQISGTHKSGNHYYVYQTTEANRKNIWDGTTFKRPVYGEVKVPDGRLWRDYITNNKEVQNVIYAWDENGSGAAHAAGMVPTENRIYVGKKIGTCNLTVDNIYSKYQQRGANNKEAAIKFEPDLPVNSYSSPTEDKLIINLVGDNRLGAIRYLNQTRYADANGNYNNHNKLVFRGNGSLTVANVKGDGYNYWDSAIGNSDDKDNCYGIVIDSGVIFAGTTYKDNSTALGAGGNGYGEVTINGGIVTAVAATSGTAIGGGIGYGNRGGEGDVTITGGTVYAYNYKNEYNVPSSAIGGAGAKTNYGSTGKVTITGGTVFAWSASGTAIGGGSSYQRGAGDAKITITGGEVTAVTDSPASCCIGGGTAYTINDKKGSGFNGGTAEISISGNPVIHTGSIGGGGTGDDKGKIGSAQITITGGNIQGQFIMAAGSGDPPHFEMSGGTISYNADLERFKRLRMDGGAVYLEDGTCELKAGTIKHCKAVNGGAVYISGKGSCSFNMTGGEISNCTSASHGGAIYMTGGKVTVSGGTIKKNLALGGNGGGVYIEGGSFYMPADGTAHFDENSAVKDNGLGGSGGAVYVTSKMTDVDVHLNSGRIIGNTSEQRGGGVCVEMDEGNSHHARVEVGTPGGGDGNPLISGNRALLQGGGLHVKGHNSEITINSGNITGNHVTAYVANNDVSNELGMVKLNGGEVTHCVVTFHINYDEKTDTDIQRIVTSTRSELNDSHFGKIGDGGKWFRTGYELESWNTRADGRGTRYERGAVMNIKTNIDLYAQWKVTIY